MPSNDKKFSYPYLGFLDFLACYVPGILVLLCTVIWSIIFQFDLSKLDDVVSFLGDDKYFRGVVLTVLFLIIPYVTGHLIFPVGYKIVKKYFRVSPPKIPTENSKTSKCTYLRRKEYCSLQNFDFTQCLKDCFKNVDPAFNAFMITRFRTLSRFCRAMLLSSIILAFSLFSLGISMLLKTVINSFSSILLSLIFLGLAIAIFASVWGFGNRYQNYEIRWRNGVCVGSGNIEE